MSSIMNYDSDEEDDYEYPESEDSYSKESDTNYDIIEDFEENDVQPVYFNFVHDILFTLYNDYILPWSVNKSNNIEMIINMSGLHNFIQLYSKNVKSENLMVVFHGSSQKALESIKESMFIVPDGENVKVKNGSAYGLGVYSSTLTSVACNYSTCGKIIVCLLAPGKINKKPPYVNSKKYDTNYCTMNQYICTFDSKRICPLFIVDKSNLNKIDEYSSIIRGFIENVFELTSERNF